LRKVILFNTISLDGMFETTDHRLDWSSPGTEITDYTVKDAQSSEPGGFIFGRATYELMAGFWPTDAAMQMNPAVARRMNDTPKYVFSRTLTKVDWSNSTLVKGDAADELQKLKQTPGGSLMIFGSGKLTSAFVRTGLIDEFQMVISPVILGSGNPMFRDLLLPVRLKLTDTHSFHNGSVLLTYQLA